MENVYKTLPPNNFILRKLWLFRKKIKTNRLFKIHFITYSIVGFMFLLIILPRIFGASDPIQSTKLYNQLHFGNYSAQITYRQYNPRKQLMIMKFKINGDSDTTALPKMKFSDKTDISEKLYTKVYRTDDDQYTVIINGLTPDFKAIQTTVKFFDNNPDINGNNSSDNNYVSFMSANENQIHNNYLKELTVGNYVTEAVNNEINRNNKSNVNKQNQISQLEQSIATNNQNITVYESSETYKIHSDKQQIQGKIDDLNNQNQESSDSIKDLKNQIHSNSQRNKLLNKKLDDIKNNNYDFTDTITQQDK